MIDLDRIPSEFLAALARLDHGSILVRDASHSEAIAYIYLIDVGLVKRHLPDPNFLYHVPSSIREEEMYSLTMDGFVACRLLEDRRNQIAKEKESKRANDAQMALDKKKDHRHDFCVAAFGGAVTLFVEHFGDLIDLINLLAGP